MLCYGCSPLCCVALHCIVFSALIVLSVVLRRCQVQNFLYSVDVEVVQVDKLNQPHSLADNLHTKSVTFSK